MDYVITSSDYKKFIIDENDHLSSCIKFFSTLYINIEGSTGSLCYSSKFKMKDKKNKVFKLLGDGWFEINYKDKFFYIYIKQIGDPLGLTEDTKIHTLIEIFIDKDEEKSNILNTFFDDASKYYVDTILDKSKENDRTTIYIWDDYWETIEKRPMRSLSTIYLGGLENKIHNKIKKFLSKETKDMYTNLGIPYKQNILFHGLPGTGKSSLIFSLASELNMNVALLHFVAEMNDLDFMRAMRRIPENTILVLEDIDVLFESRKKNDENKSSISFSGY